MPSKPSRTTKKVRLLLVDRSIDVAVPAERIEQEAADEAKPNLIERARQTAATGTERDVILAFGDHGVSILTTKSSNPGLPATLLRHVEGPPAVVDDTDRGLVIRLDGDDHRIGPIHAGSVRPLLSPEPPTAEPDTDSDASKSDSKKNLDSDTGDTTIATDSDTDATDGSDLDNDAGDTTTATDSDTTTATDPDNQTYDNDTGDSTTATDSDATDTQNTDNDTTGPGDKRSAPTPEPIPILDDFAPDPDAPQDAIEDEERPPDSDGPKVPTNKTTSRAQQAAPAAGILYAVPARAHQPVLQPGETEVSSGAKKALRTALGYVPLIGIALAGTRERDPHDVVLAFDADGTRVFTTSARNPAIPRDEVVRIANPEGIPEFTTADRSGAVVTVAHMTFTVGPIYVDGLRAFLALEDRAADMAPIQNAWTEVVKEFENQFRLPSDLDFPVEKRSRSTIQCQRLIPDRWVALAVPAKATPRPGSDDRKGNVVIAFTDAGPWLFSASGGNPALPREQLGLIEDASPISFGPHEREGGVLTLGPRAYLVPIAYADSLRHLIVEMSQADDEPG